MFSASLSGRFRTLLCAPLLVCGVHAEDSDWARARLNDGGNFSATSFSYPVTTQKVRLYLIDTAVKQGNNAYGNWFKKNGKLTLKPTQRINSGSSQSFEHGTKLLSIVAGPETGVALGTPIEAVNYDAFMGKEPGFTDSGSISMALYQARLHHLQQPEPRLPGVICLASGSFEAAQSAMMEDAVNQCVAAGLTVVVSAGNQNKDAGQFVPSAYGTKAGVICVGASGKNNLRYPTSNFGAAVDLYAPGEDVRTLRYGDGGPKAGIYELMDGTSPACALTAAAALVELSKNPALTPAQVEENLKAAAYVPEAPPAPSGSEDISKLVQIDPEPDTDGDGASDVLETFFATDPNDAEVRPPALGVSVPSGTNQITASFQIAEALFDEANPYQLTNGGIWSMQYSTDLANWTQAEGTLLPDAVSGGKRAMSFTAAGQADAFTGFLRIQVSMPTTTP
jgi:hypothetical protein